MPLAPLCLTGFKRRRVACTCSRRRCERRCPGCLVPGPSWRSDHAPVHPEDLTRDPARTVAHQEADNGGNVARLSEALLRNGMGDVADRLRGLRTVEEAGVHGAGGHEIDRYPS